MICLMLLISKEKKELESELAKVRELAEEKEKDNVNLDLIVKQLRASVDDTTRELEILKKRGKVSYFAFYCVLPDSVSCYFFYFSQINPCPVVDL